MISLQPTATPELDCPHCDRELTATGWKMPGMRNLVEATCSSCDREYFADLPVGHALLYPAIVEKESGTVHQPVENWFGQKLEEAYADRSADQLQIDVTRHDDVSDPIVLNTLDVNYAHVVYKLLNAQYYLDEHPELDLIVVVPKFVEWLVPSGVAEVWSVGVSLADGGGWYEELDRRLHERLNGFERCRLSVAYPHPHPDDFDVERFSGVEPFPLDEWERRLSEPTVTFVWRDVPSYSSIARLWCSVPDTADPRRRVRGYLNLVADELFGWQRPARSEQLENIVTTAEFLRERFPNLDCAVAGVGSPGELPAWIDDQCVEAPSDRQEVELCERYADSHVVVGVHGSNMMLPSGHAGATVELIPPRKRENILGDQIQRGRDTREAQLRYRTVPSTMSPEDVANEVTSLLVEWPQRRLRLQPEFSDHDRTRENVERLPKLERDRVSQAETLPDVSLGGPLVRRLYDILDR